MINFPSQQLQLFRSIQTGGDAFIDTYLKKFSDRETDANFNLRSALAPSAAFAKKEVINVQNAIYQRLTDITRYGGSDSYQRVVAGGDNGIDLDHATMSHFIGQDVLSEMLFMGEVGVLVDMPKLEGKSLLDTDQDHPYCYVYRVEQIENYAFSHINGRRTLTALKLSEEIPVLDEFGLPKDTTITRTIIFNLLDYGVQVRTFEKRNLVSTEILDIPA